MPRFLRPLPVLSIFVATFGCLGAAEVEPSSPRAYTRLVPLAAPRVSAMAEEYPGGSYRAVHLIDGNPRTEYSSNAKGLETFVEFDFGTPVRVAAFRHVNRNDPGTVAASELVFLDVAGTKLARVVVEHDAARSGAALALTGDIPAATRVRWQVTRLGNPQVSTVGGAEVQFFAAGEVDETPKALECEAQAPDLVELRNGARERPLDLHLRYPYAEPVAAVVRIGSEVPRPVTLSFGGSIVSTRIPDLETPLSLPVALDIGGREVLARRVEIAPARKWLIHLLPHSHVDIGYTALQAEVEAKQDENIETGLRLISATREYPEGARFKWNVEVLWPVENYLRKASSEKRESFLAAVKSGEVGLDAFYGNILTGLSRPEELIRLMTYATRLTTLTGVKVDSAMISDVPGYTWSTVTAMLHAGVRYFSFAPNYFDRMGGTMVEWQDRPFWWKAPDGKDRVLCWCPSRGYALGHLIGDGEALARFIPAYLQELQAKAYPYDMTHLRWNVHGDNGSPDEKVAQVVREWNATHVWPRLVISTTGATFREFERRYGDRLPEFAGDYTPYWEDGAGSSALETALNRDSAERLVQAETLWLLRDAAGLPSGASPLGASPLGAFPTGAFDDAWRNILLYSEHTWGAHNSISQPDLPFVLEQWKVKRAFAHDADRQSRALLERVLGAPKAPVQPQAPRAIDVLNTCSFERTDLVLVSAELSRGAERVMDAAGKGVPSQRLQSGELAFVARAVPAFGASRYTLAGGGSASKGDPEPRVEGPVKASGSILSHPALEVRIDERTGAIASLRDLVRGVERVDAKAATQVNEYFYLLGNDASKAERAGPPRIAVEEAGPLVAALRIESEAPGTRAFVRRVRVVAGLDRVDIHNTVDKLPIRAKEGVHFGFGFLVPDATVRLDVGLAVVRPEVDQIPASCKNWFSVQRWVDVANAEGGVTWATLDAPLVELGGLTANLLGSQTDHRVWIQKLEPTSTLYSWSMNNHWHTNYRVEQDGPVTFRYAIRSHGGYMPIDTARFGVSLAQPLLVAAASGAAPAESPIRIESKGVLATALKPSDDGKAWILRLFGASGEAETVRVVWRGPGSVRLWSSDTSERGLRECAADRIEVAGWGLVTLRVEKR